MSLESAIVSLLAADTTVSAAVSSRIYPDWAPVGAALPMIVYTRPSAMRVQAAEGSIGMVDATVEVSCWAKTKAAAMSLADAVRYCLDAYNGTTDWLAIACIRLDADSDTPLTEPGNEEMNEYGVTLTFTVWYHE